MATAVLIAVASAAGLVLLVPVSYTHLLQGRAMLYGGAGFLCGILLWEKERRKEDFLSDIGEMGKEAGGQ